MTKQLKVYRDGRIRNITASLTKADLEKTGYFTRHPGAIVFTPCPQPGIATLEKWEERGSYKAADGCSGIESDGYCQHGLPSWVLVLIG
jgi:hypothetical protein